MDKRLAVVTGASSGIGLELARQFAKNSFGLIIVAEDEKIKQAEQTLKDEFNVEVQGCEINLATYEGVEEFYQVIKGARQPVDAIALNAGVGISGDFVEHEALKDILNVINLNVVSTVHLAKRVLRDMVEARQGKVLFTSSISSKLPEPYLSVYAATKAFIQSFASGIREEVKDTGVTVTLLMPGATDTNFFKRAGLDGTKLGEMKKDDPENVAEKAFDALMAGKYHVITGKLRDRIQVRMANLFSDKMITKMKKDEARPGSAYH